MCSRCLPFSLGHSNSELPNCTIIREYPLRWSSFWTSGRRTSFTKSSNLVVPTVTKTVLEAESILTRPWSILPLL